MDYEEFMLTQVTLWMRQKVTDPETIVPHSVLAFYFEYTAKSLHDDNDEINR